MNNLVKRIFKSLICAALTLPAVVSCYDDSQIWDKLNELEKRVDSLQVNLNEQASALSDLMGSGTTISSCTKNADGSYTIELSNGTDFTVLPAGTKFSSLVTYMQKDGKMTWATYDADGNLVPLVGVGPGKIQVKLVDEVYHVVIDGVDYPTGFTIDDNVQIFSSCTPMADDSGQVYAVKLTVGDGWEVTMAVDGYKGVLFKISSISTSVENEYYIDFGQSQSFYMDTRGVIDYVMQIPDGWRVVESLDKLSGEITVKITAPSEETVALQAAVASGDLKVVSVVEGGKAAVTKLSLSTNPYKTYDVNALKAVIDPYKGIQKFFYGISTDYNRAGLMGQITAHLENSTALPEGIFQSETGIDKMHSEINPNITEGQNYTFWSVPALYTEGDETQKAGFYVKEEMFREFNLTPMSVDIKVEGVALLDADINVKVLGVNQMYAGVSPKSETVLDEIVAGVNNGAYDALSDKSLMSYAGPVSTFIDSENPEQFDPETEYVVWVIPIEAGKTKFSVSDVVYTDFKTKAVTAGGTLEAVIAEADVKASSITHKVSSEGAVMMYYAFIEGSVGERITTYSNESMYNEILKASTFATVRASSFDAVIDDLMPETKMWLFAVPIAADGKYGKVAFASATTSAVTFSSLSVSLEKVLIESDKATYKVNVNGGSAVDYIYWVGRKTDPFWVEICGSNRTVAGKFMAANPEHEAILKAMKTSGPVAADGTLIVSDLTIAKEHILLVLAKDEKGLYSKAGYAAFETLSINLGANYVAEGTDKWNETKALIENSIDWDEAYFESPGSGLMCAFAFNISVPKELTAYISCYATEAANNGGTLLDIMVELEKNCLSKTVNNPVIKDPETGDDALLPDWIDDTGRLIQGSMVNVYQMFPHGDPSDGEVTFFASEGHDDTHCDVWDDGECSNYASQLASIEELQTLEYWIEHFKGTAGNYDTGDPSTSRVLKDEENLMNVAKAYQETYIKYYSGMKPNVFVNDGTPLRVSTRQASGLDENGKVIDVVTVMLKDLDGNYYDPMYFPVPNFF